MYQDLKFSLFPPTPPPSSFLRMILITTLYLAFNKKGLSRENRLRKTACLLHFGHLRHSAVVVQLKSGSFYDISQDLEVKNIRLMRERLSSSHHHAVRFFRPCRICGGKRYIKRSYHLFIVPAQHLRSHTIHRSTMQLLSIIMLVSAISTRIASANPLSNPFAGTCTGTACLVGIQGNCCDGSACIPIESLCLGEILPNTFGVSSDIIID